MGGWVNGETGEKVLVCCRGYRQPDLVGQIGQLVKVAKCTPATWCHN